MWIITKYCSPVICCHKYTSLSHLFGLPWWKYSSHCWWALSAQPSSACTCIRSICGKSGWWKPCLSPALICHLKSAEVSTVSIISGSFVISIIVLSSCFLVAKKINSMAVMVHLSYLHFWSYKGVLFRVQLTDPPAARWLTASPSLQSTLISIDETHGGSCLMCCIMD